MSEQTYEGTCLCESIKIVLHGSPVKAMACHCIDCQKSAGGPYQTCAIYPTSRVEIIDPNQHLQRYVIPKERVGSGFEKHKFFCSVCATPLFNQPMKHNGEKTVIKTGFFDPSKETNESGLDLFKPQGELYVKDRASFVAPIEGIAQHEKGF
ncbi:MAG: Mss4-like protein [Benjaminiella poitrasii]|nr:MAG: Mss4-like protein [Benjaminiella poitrasii]